MCLGFAKGLCVARKHCDEGENNVFLDIMRLIAIKELQCNGFNMVHVK